MNPRAPLLQATSVVALLGFCCNLISEGAAVNHVVPPRSVQVESALSVDEVLGHLQKLILNSSIGEPSNTSDEEFHKLALRASRYATDLLQLLDLHANSVRLALWHDVQHEWKEFCANTEMLAIRDDLVRVAVGIKHWLGDSLSDDESILNMYVNKLWTEADRLSSIRGAEIVSLRRDILSVLGYRQSKKTISNQKAVRPIPKSLNGSLQSSDSSVNESPKSRVARKRRKPPHMRQTGQQTAGSDTVVWATTWLPIVTTKLTEMVEWARVVPVELRVLKQVNYESKDSREDSIREAESGTFSWMLDDTTAVQRLEHMEKAREIFITWLSSGDGVFHISGNAGAGKSTLMKYLRHHPRTKSELQAWAGQSHLIFSSFYFWNSGSQMQMSLEGLYRSLLLEICRKCPDLIPALFPDQWAALVASPVVSTSDEKLIGTREIDEAFSILLKSDVSDKYRMCFFIDGLDEYTGEIVDYRSLAKAIRIWGENSAIKLCVSARPYSEFLDTFDASLRLHLHELTSQDISKYTMDAFRRAIGPRLSNEDKLVEMIIQKSEGVFLWARAVVRALLNLAGRGIGEAEVQQALDSYPRDIYELYGHMLQSLGPEESMRSNQMLLLAIRNPFAQALNALYFSWIEALDSPGFPPIQLPYPSAEIAARHAVVRTDLEYLTKGLLEMHSDRRERKDGDQFYRQRIQFSHRTARDFLQAPARKEQLQDTFGSSSPTEVMARLRLAEIVLAGKYKMNPGADPRRRRLYFNYVRSLFNLRDSRGERYQIPTRYMRALADDLAITSDTSKFSGPYAVSSYASMTSRDIFDEDPEKAASFLHLALSHGQHQYVLEELQERGKAAAERENDELSLALSTAFGQRLATLEIFKALLAFDKSPLSMIKTRPPLGNDVLVNKSTTVSVLTIFIATLMSKCLGATHSELGQRSRSTTSWKVADLFDMLGCLLDSAVREHLSIANPLSYRLPYLCILHAVDPEERSDKIFFTTLGQVANHFAPLGADRLMILLGEPTPKEERAVASGNNRENGLPFWASMQLKQHGLAGDLRFVGHESLQDYSCGMVLSPNEMVSTSQNLFFRVY